MHEFSYLYLATILESWFYHYSQLKVKKSGLMDFFAREQIGAKHQSQCFNTGISDSREQALEPCTMLSTHGSGLPFQRK